MGDTTVRSEHYQNGFQRGRQGGNPFHHNLDKQAMDEYLEGYRVGQAEWLMRQQRSIRR